MARDVWSLTQVQLVRWLERNENCWSGWFGFWGAWRVERRSAWFATSEWTARCCTEQLYWFLCHSFIWFTSPEEHPESSWSCPLQSVSSSVDWVTTGITEVGLLRQDNGCCSMFSATKPQFCLDEETLHIILKCCPFQNVQWWSKHSRFLRVSSSAMVHCVVRQTCPDAWPFWHPHFSWCTP